MSRTPKSPAPAPAPAPAQEPIDASISLSGVPAVTALIVLLDAMRALVSFPSRPVPDTLVEGVLNARQQFNEAVNTPFVPVAVPGSAAYDDAWIGERFDKFAALIDERFVGQEKAGATRDEALKTALAAVDERFEGLDEALKARFAAFDEAGNGSAAELASLKSRLEALEARATAQAKD